MVCGGGVPSIGTIWKRELPSLKEALLHSPANVPFGSRSKELNILIEKVFRALPTSRLRRSVRPASHPDSDSKILRILDILAKRYINPSDNPPLRILVFGGSPVVGSNCERNNRLKKQGHCAWPGHLQEFINAYLRYDAVEVINYGIGASSSSIATMMLQLRIFPRSMLPDGPDIIMNAYAVNDFSYHSDGSSSFGEMFTSFLQAANDLSNCKRDRPLVLFLDDFSVNFWRGHAIEPVESYRAEITKYTNYHHVPTISFVDTIQDFLYGTPGNDEEQLLVDWKGDSKHITWGGHIAIVITIVYNALQTLIDSCDTMDKATEKNALNQTQLNNYGVLDAYVRPKLHDNGVTLNNIHELWTGQHNCHNGAVKTCPFAWVALRKEEEHSHMEDIDSIIVEADNWENVRAWPPTNYGFFGSENGTAVLHVEDENMTGSTTLVSSIKIIYMKSYSEKWQNSQIRAVARRCNEEVGSVDISGFHEKSTSEYFVENISLKTEGLHDCNDPGVYLSLHMIGGSTFRIGGIAFC